MIKELNYTAEEIATVKKIQKEITITKRTDKIRAVLNGPLCCCCGSIPSFHVQYPLGDLTGIERYCDKCFHDIYENTIDVTNETIAERYGIVKGDLPK
jgi:hypothetical protein